MTDKERLKKLEQAKRLVLPSSKLRFLSSAQSVNACIQTLFTASLGYLTTWLI